MSLKAASSGSSAWTSSPASPTITRRGMNMTERLAGKVAIVTGGNSGIGSVTAHLFAREGAKVALMARREDQGKNVEKAIRDEGAC